MTAKKKKKKTKRQNPESATPPAEAAADGGAASGPEALGGAEDTLETEGPVGESAVEAQAELERELEELQDRHLRLAAEYDNFRKRTARERAQNAQQAQAELVRELLESLDDLARVGELGSTDHDAAAILEGVRLVERKLSRALEALGLRPIEATGQPFDPEIHEALVTVPVDDPEEDNLVSQELVKGYTFKETLLRPSRVEVKKYQPTGPLGEGGADDSENDS